MTAIKEKCKTDTDNEKCEALNKFYALEEKKQINVKNWGNFQMLWCL